MGKKKWCFGREDFVCLTQDCPYMSDCIKVVWDKKVSRMITRMRPSSASMADADDSLEPVSSGRRRSKRR
ncbi:MAG: hypothetical protein ACYTG4_11360 [Planctomycetota bacterium]|jgi:hypothetical protein